MGPAPRVRRRWVERAARPGGRPCAAVTRFVPVRGRASVAVRAGSLLAAALLALTACRASSGDEGQGDDGTAVTVATVAVLPLPGAATTPGVSAPGVSAPTGSAATPTNAPATTRPPVAPTTGPVATGPAPTTTTATGSATTTAPTAVTTSSPVAATTTGGAPCSLDTVVQQSGAPTEGVTPAGLACAGEWATFVGRPDDQFGDGYFAVARWDGGRWQLANLGTAEVCAGAGVPAELWNALRCD